jgi:CxxC-x17-CxxC domain-containing protein
MGNFRSDNRGRGFGGNRSSGDSGRFGGRGGFRDRDSRRPGMHEVTCDKCGKQCEVPFRPTGDKPVFCSDCFRKEGGSSSSSKDNSSSSGISSEQYKEINKKLDKILKILEMIEFEDEEDSEEDEDESDEDEEDEEEEDDDEDDDEDEEEEDDDEDKPKKAK